MNKLQSLEGRIFRAKLDGVYYSSNVQLIQDEIENAKLAEEKLNKIVEKIRVTLNFTPNEVFADKYGKTLESTDRLGIYTKVSLRATCLNINIQFKGYFFTFSDCWYRMRCHMFDLMLNLKLFFRPTLIDIAQDVGLKTYETLPLPAPDNLSNGFIYNFKFKTQKFSERYEFHIDTGFCISNSRFKLKVYDKIAENRKSRNLQKKQYYDKLYSQFDDVTRIELTLRQESCRRFWTEIYTTQLSEEDFALYCLKHFAKKHSIRVKPTSSSDNDISRWPKLENWIYLFERSGKELLKLDTTNDFVFSKSSLTIEGVLSNFVELLSSQREVSLDELITKLKIFYPKIIRKIQSKRQRNEYTLDQLNSLLAEVMAQGIFVSEEGGDSITSPPSSKSNAFSNTYSLTAS